MSSMINATWYLQVQDAEGNVLVLNHCLGKYKGYSKHIQNKADKVAYQFPTAKRWQVIPNPYTSKVVL